MMNYGLIKNAMTILYIFFESNLKPVGLLTGLYIEKCLTSVPIYFMLSSILSICCRVLENIEKTLALNGLNRKSNMKQVERTEYNREALHAGTGSFGLLYTQSENITVYYFRQVISVSWPWH